MAGLLRACQLSPYARATVGYRVITVKAGTVMVSDELRQRRGICLFEQSRICFASSGDAGSACFELHDENNEEAIWGWRHLTQCVRAKVTQ